MNTEVLFESDAAFKDFSMANFGNLSVVAPSEIESGYVCYLDDADAQRLILAYAIEKRDDGNVIEDVNFIPWEPPFAGDIIARAAQAPKPIGMRHYICLDSPLFRAPIVAVDASRTMCAGNFKSFAEGELATGILSGCALEIQQRKPTDEVRLLIHDNAEVRLRRMQGTLGPDEPAEFHFYRVRSLTSYGDEEAPEVYEFTGIVEDVRQGEFRGIPYFMLHLSCMTADDSVLIHYTVYAGESVLQGYRPRVGDSVTGLVALTVSLAASADAPDNKTDTQLYLQAEKQIVEGGGAGPDALPQTDPIVREETFPWGKVGYNAEGRAICCTPAEDFPVKSEMKGMALWLPQHPEPGAKTSRFRARTLQNFSFPDEFAALLPKDLEVCEPDRDYAMTALHHVRMPRAPWKDPERAEDFAVIQMARSASENRILCRIAYTEPLSLCPKYILLLLDGNDGRLIRYTVDVDPIGTSGACRCIGYQGPDGYTRIYAPTIDDALWERIRTEKGSEFVMVSDVLTGEFFQFTTDFADGATAEFQIASLDLQFTASPVTFDDIRTAYQYWHDRDIRLYTCLPWTHCVIPAK